MKILDNNNIKNNKDFKIYDDYNNIKKEYKKFDYNKNMNNNDRTIYYYTNNKNIKKNDYKFKNIKNNIINTKDKDILKFGYNSNNINNTNMKNNISGQKKIYFENSKNKDIFDYSNINNNKDTKIFDNNSKNIEIFDYNINNNKGMQNFDYNYNTTNFESLESINGNIEYINNTNLNKNIINKDELEKKELIDFVNNYYSGKAKNNNNDSYQIEDLLLINQIDGNRIIENTKERERERIKEKPIDPNLLLSTYRNFGFGDNNQ